MRKSFFILSLLLLFLCNGFSSYGQILATLFSDEHDSSYIDSYKSQLTTRLYTSRKYTDLKIRDNGQDATLRYHPNDRFNLGFGASYNAFTLNIGINFPFINHDDDKYGKTDYLDLQSHMLFRKLTAELYFSAFKGYYVSNPDDILLHYEESTIYPQRRDMLTLELAGSLYYIFNNTKFSYRAAFNQDERQKKSAGSFLAGPAIFTIYTQGDSSLIPYDVEPPDFFDGVPMKRTRYAKATLNAGYAYNLIIWERFFITASLILGPGAGYMIIYPETDDINGQRKFDFAFSYTARAAAGYNGKRLYVGLSYVNTSLNSPTPVDKARYIFRAGNIRFNIAYRIPFNVDVAF